MTDSDINAPCAYIMSNRSRTAFYIGATVDLKKRVLAHKYGLVGNRKDTIYLVWFRGFETLEEAVTYDRELKGWQQPWQVSLIEGFNPDWEDLSKRLGFVT